MDTTVLVQLRHHLASDKSLDTLYCYFPELRDRFAERVFEDKQKLIYFCKISDPVSFAEFTSENASISHASAGYALAALPKLKGLSSDIAILCRGSFIDGKLLYFAAQNTIGNSEDLHPHWETLEEAKKRGMRHFYVIAESNH
jgi:hypothetical protein